MDYKRLTQEIKKGLIRPLYLFVGRERLLMEETLELLKERLNPGSRPALSPLVLQGRDARASLILEELRTLALFPGRKLIFVQEADLLPRPEQEKLIPYLESPAKSHCLILHCEQQRSLELLLPHFRSKGAIVEFQPLAPARLLGWIREKAADAGYRISNQAAQVLLENNEADPSLIKTELEKVIAYKGESGSVIELEDLNQVGWGSSIHHIFQLTEALGNRQKERALYLLHRLMGQGEPPLLILSLIARHLRQLWYIKELTQNYHYPPEAVARILGVSPYWVKKNLTQAQTFTLEQLNRLFSRLLEIDFSLKTTDSSGKHLLENFIWGLIE